MHQLAREVFSADAGPYGSLSRCRRRCPGQRRAVSNIGLGVGVLAAAVGTYFLFDDLSASKPAPTARITPAVSLGQREGTVGLRGSF